MNAVIIKVARGRDGKLYPPEKVSQADAARLRVLVHQLRCRHGLTFRQVQAALAEHGYRRSLGRIHKILAAYACDRCR